MKFNPKWALQLTVSIILLGLLFHWIDIGEIKSSLLNAKVSYLLLSLLILTVNRIIMSIKWNLLLRAKEIDISWFEVTKIYYVSNFLGFFLPPTVGTDIVRAYYVAKKKYPLEDIISSILVERFLGFIVLFLFGIAGAGLFIRLVSDSGFDTQKLFSVIVLISFFGLFAFFLSFNSYSVSLASRLFKFLNSGRRVGVVGRKLKKAYQSYLKYRSEKRILMIFFLLTCFELFTCILRSYTVAIAINASVSLSYFFAFIPIILVLIRLPISIHGFGINEGGFAYFLSLFGVSETLGFSVGIIDHFVVLVGILPGAIFYAFGRLSGQINRERSVIILKKVHDSALKDGTNKEIV